MNKPDYQKMTDEIIGKSSFEGRKPTLLLHSCCGPCSSYVVTYLMQYFDITVFYYNPNIFPVEEYEHRLSEQKRLLDDLSVPLITVPYDHRDFLCYVKGLEEEREGGARCSKCFELRLAKTADLASERGFEYFGTTLTVSPHKNAVVINEIGAGLSDSVKWLPSDFKKRDGYKKSIEISAQYGLYRQNYCGCEFSIWF